MTTCSRSAGKRESRTCSRSTPERKPPCRFCEKRWASPECLVNGQWRVTWAPSSQKAARLSVGCSTAVRPSWAFSAEGTRAQSQRWTIPREDRPSPQSMGSSMDSWRGSAPPSVTRSPSAITASLKRRSDSTPNRCTQIAACPNSNTSSPIAWARSSSLPGRAFDLQRSVSRHHCLEAARSRALSLTRVMYVRLPGAPICAIPPNVEARPAPV
jgi:hypothetical protein